MLWKRNYVGPEVNSGIHYYKLIFTARTKSIFTASLRAGGEISAVKILIFTVGP
jgi:hypothetical protein